MKIIRPLMLVIAVSFGIMTLAMGVGGLWRGLSYFNTYLHSSHDVVGKVADYAPPQNRCRRIEYDEPEGKTHSFTACGLSERPDEKIHLLVSEDGETAVIDDSASAVMDVFTGVLVFYCVYAFVTNERRKRQEAALRKTTAG